jgi:hypothetical protein
MNSSSSSSSSLTSVRGVDARDPENPFDLFVTVETEGDVVCDTGWAGAPGAPLHFAQNQTSGVWPLGDLIKGTAHPAVEHCLSVKT